MPIANGIPHHPIRVVVTAASTLAVSQLARELSSDPSLQISMATNIANLWQEIEAARPAVVLLDTRLVGEKTAALVTELMTKAGVAILIRAECSDTNSNLLLNCLEAGALGVLDKPMSTEQTAEALPSLIWNLKAAAQAKVSNLVIGATAGSSASNAASDRNHTGATANSIIAIGGGLGGAAALANVLTQLPGNAPATLAIAPLPPPLLAAWVHRVGSRSAMKIKLASDNHPITAGTILVAPGDAHMMIRRTGNDYSVKIKSGPAVFHARPSVEILFSSVADTAGAIAVGVLLSGAGIDGVAAMLHLRKSGGRTITESPTTSVFPELPGKAMKCGAAESSASALELPTRIIELAVPQRFPQAA